MLDPNLEKPAGFNSYGIGVPKPAAAAPQRVGVGPPATAAPAQVKLSGPDVPGSMPAAPAPPAGPRPLPGTASFMNVARQAGETMGHVGTHLMNGVMNSPLNAHTWHAPGSPPAAPAVSPPKSATAQAPAPAGDGGSVNPIQHPAASPAGTRFPVASSPTPHADALNSFYDKQGYGPGQKAQSVQPAPQAAAPASVKPNTAQPAPQAAAPATASSARPASNTPDASSLPAYRPNQARPGVSNPALAARADVDNGGWKPGQPPQWPIKPMPAGTEPYWVARARQINELAAIPQPAYKATIVHPNYNPGGPPTTPQASNPWYRTQGGPVPPPGSPEYGGFYQRSPEMKAWEDHRDQAAQDLFKQYNGGWDKGDVRMFEKAGIYYGNPEANNGRGWGPQGGEAGGGHDAYRDSLIQQMQNPGASYEGGIAVHRGQEIGMDGSTGPSMADMADQRRVTAQNQLAAYDTTRANIRKSDAEVEQGDTVKQLDKLSKLPQSARAIYLAGKGVDSNTINGLPRHESDGEPRYNATNVADAAGDPALARASEVINSDAPIHEKAAIFSSIPGIERPGSPARQLWDAFMSRQQARGGEFDQEMGQYNPMDPGGSVPRPGIWNSIPFVKAYQEMTGADDGLRARNVKFGQDMGRLGYGPGDSGRPGSANDMRRRIGVKQADY